MPFPIIRCSLNARDEVEETCIRNSKPLLTGCPGWVIGPKINRHRSPRGIHNSVPPIAQIRLPGLWDIGGSKPIVKKNVKLCTRGRCGGKTAFSFPLRFTLNSPLRRACWEQCEIAKETRGRDRRAQTRMSERFIEVP
jgi:hypothetical protein